MSERIAFDCVLRRPGCVLIQAAMGCSSRLAHAFPAETWLVYPTPDMAVYNVTKEQIPRLIEMAIEAVEP